MPTVTMDTAMLSAIGSPRRREILRLLWDQELTAGAIHQAMPDVTFGAVSLQLKVLAEAGLVESRADAQFRVYKVRREALGPVAAMLESMWTDALWNLKLKAELKESRRGPQPRRRPRLDVASALRRKPQESLRRKPHESKGKKR